MVGETKPRDAGVRFEGYLRDLREFFASRQVRFGRPEDVIDFAARVGTPGPLQEEMGSMVRSIVYCEDERLGREELLELVVVAVGGPSAEPGMEGLPQAIRQLFGFLNEALRQSGSAYPGESDPEPEADDPAVTVGDILRSEPVEAAVSLPPEAPAPRAVALDRRTPAGSGVLFRAVTMAEEQDKAAPTAAVGRVLTRPTRGWVLPASAFVAAAAVVLYLVWPTLAHWMGSRREASANQPVGVISAAPAASACVAPVSARVSLVAVEQQSLAVRGMLDQKMYAAALPQLQAIAAADPGFPGVYLDLSDALLQLKLPEQARDAVDRELAISECLAKLPEQALEMYCREQFAPSALGACRPQLAHIRQTAELQAAMVHLELGHRIDPGDGAAAMDELTGDAATAAGKTRATTAERPVARTQAAPVIRPQPAPIVRRTPPLPPAREGDAAQPAVPRSQGLARSPTAGANGRSAEGDPSLRRGEGTDSVFGAYQKPQ